MDFIKCGESLSFVLISCLRRLILPYFYSDDARKIAVAMKRTKCTHLFIAWQILDVVSKLICFTLIFIILVEVILQLIMNCFQIGNYRKKIVGLWL